MCLYPKPIRNKKYLPTKKNNYNPPKMVDPRTAYITAGKEISGEILNWHMYRDWETKTKRMVSKNERGTKDRT